MNKKNLLTTIAAVVLIAANCFTLGCYKGKKVEVTGIQVSPSSIMVRVNNNTTLDVEIIPFEASNWAVKWSSSDTNIATVEQLGSDGVGAALVTPHAVGEAIITGKSEDGGFTSSSTVIVNPVEIDDDYATSVPAFYTGNTKIDGQTVELGKIITIKYHSRNKIVFSIDESFKLSITDEVEGSIKVDQITDIEKLEYYTYKFTGAIDATIMGISYPATLEGMISVSTIDLKLEINNVPELGDVLINFKGEGKSSMNVR